MKKGTKWGIYNLVNGLLFGLISVIWLFYTSPKIVFALNASGSNAGIIMSFLNKSYLIELFLCSLSIIYGIWNIFRVNKEGFYPKAGRFLFIATLFTGSVSSTFVLWRFIIMARILLNF